ncbi:MAG TPA: DUF4307 domain-containing protein [Nocardioidaceae bacterium]|nr:DUF4307 domain-containing protein [Nocardioidaceae bacterium]
MSDLAQRYGTGRRPARTALVAGVAVLAVVALAWLVWAIVTHNRSTISAQLVSFRPPGQHAVVAKVSVTRPDPQMTASCVLQAVAADHAVVGELALSVGPPRPASTTLTTTIRTERRAYNVQLVRCVPKG